MEKHCFCLIMYLLSFTLSSCVRGMYTFPIKKMDKYIDGEFSQEIFHQGYSFELANIGKYNEFIKVNPYHSYLKSVDGFPNRYFIISNNTLIGTSFFSIKVENIDDSSNVSPCAAYTISENEELIVYDLNSLTNFCMYRHQSNMSELVGYKCLIFNSVKFAKKFDFNKYLKYEKLDIVEQYD